MIKSTRIAFSPKVGVIYRLNKGAVLNYEFILTDNTLSFLSTIKSLFDTGTPLELYLPSENLTGSIRTECDGIITARGIIAGKSVGVVLNDFKIKGGGFGTENSRRMVAFLKQMKNEETPVIFIIDSIGVRIMEGRKVFDGAFRVIPALKDFVKDNLLITVVKKRALGLGALLYTFGDYRFAISEDSHLNLTGPEVFKMFFGAKANFDEIASSKRQQKKNSIVHDICDSQEEVNRKIREIFLFSNVVDNGLLVESSRHGSNADADPTLDAIGSTRIELFSQLSPVVKIHMHKMLIYNFATFMNPKGKANMITVEAIKKFRLALNLLKKLKLPIFTIVDTPGGDPRVEENDKGILEEMTQMTVDIIDYPYLKKGFITGRCYGGASVSSIPPFFGGQKTTIVEGGACGIMGDNIISHLLSSSPRLHAEWEENRTNEKADFSDYMEQGILDKIIKRDEIGTEIIATLINNRNVAENDVNVDEYLMSVTGYSANKLMSEYSKYVGVDEDLNWLVDNV